MKARVFAEQHPEWSELWLAQLHYVRRDYEKALHAYRSHPMTTEAWRQLGRLYMVTNDQERLKMLGDSLRPGLQKLVTEAVEARASASVISATHAWLGLANAFAGNEESAVLEARRALETYDASSDARNYWVILEMTADIYLLVGHDDEAIDHLEAMLSVPSETKAARLRLDPFYDPLRDHLRFQALLDKY